MVFKLVLEVYSFGAAFTELPSMMHQSISYNIWLFFYFYFLVVTLNMTVPLFQQSLWSATCLIIWYFGFYVLYNSVFFHAWVWNSTANVVNDGKSGLSSQTVAMVTIMRTGAKVFQHIIIGCTKKNKVCIYCVQMLINKKHEKALTFFCVDVVSVCIFNASVLLEYYICSWKFMWLMYVCMHVWCVVVPVTGSGRDHDNILYKHPGARVSWVDGLEKQHKTRGCLGH